MSPVPPYDEAMEALSSLISRRSRADNSNKGDGFDLLFDYIKILELEEPIKQMKIIHVAGTKGKGSTCTFTESILRNCGFRTGLFTSPHLIDVRERFRLDGVDLCEEKFMAYFWWCWDRLKERTSDEVPMPTYFRFLALLAFKIFAAERVDVAILEVGLGGKYDATNVVEKPVVCGISSLGYDHMEILGNTLGQIAEQKAGIFKPGVPAFTVTQPEEAMHVLEQKALQLHVPLQVVAPLDPNLLSGLCLGLEGEHQYLNAGLAVALSKTWLHRTGHVGVNDPSQSTSLPKEFIEGLTTAVLQGRAQIVPDKSTESENTRSLVFYLDGAHSPESMDVCAKWFCRAIKEGNLRNRCLRNQGLSDPGPSCERLHIGRYENIEKKFTQILLFNCMSVREPRVLLPRLMSACATRGVHFKKALFVPNTSLYNKIGTSSSPRADYQVDLSWQLSLQRIWETVIHGEKDHMARNSAGRRNAKNTNLTCEQGAEDTERGDSTCMNSKVFPSLPLAINWLRESVRRNQSTHFQVLVTGSLHLVGDVLRLIKK